MQYQTKWMTNMLKLFSPRQFSLTRTLLVAGLLIGCLGIAFVSLQQSLLNAQARSATPQHSGQDRSVSITISSHVDQQRVTYKLTVYTGAHASIIHRGIPIIFTDSIPVGLSHISVKGNYWNTKISSNIGPSLVTGTYKGSYPLGPGATLPTVIIEGTINNHASNVLTNDASVDVWDNTDKVHNKASVSDNIHPTLSSLSLLNSDDNSGTCDSRCNSSGNNVCDNQCGSSQSSSDACSTQCGSSQSSSDACSTQCGSSQSSSDACSTQCGSSQSSSDACSTQCGSSQSSSDACSTQCGSSQSSSDACSTQCDQTSLQASNQEKVHVSVQENESVDASCECSHTGDGTVSTPNNTSKGSTTPFPALPNTGSDPVYKG